MPSSYGRWTQLVLVHGLGDRRHSGSGVDAQGYSCSRVPNLTSKGLKQLTTVQSPGVCFGEK